MSASQCTLIELRIKNLKTIKELESTKVWRTFQHFSLTHGAAPLLRRRQLCGFSRTSQHFMKAAGSLPCSQELSTGPYP
jgi:hypothetical protein